MSLDPTIPCQAVVYDLVRGIFLPTQQFPWDNITCCASIEEQQQLTWQNWVPAGSSWVQIPYSSWTVIPGLFTQSMILGTESSYAMRFFNASTDNQSPIAYNATWGLRQNPDLTKSMKINWAEFYLQQIATGPNSSLTFNEVIEADILSFIQPLDSSPIFTTAVAMSLADQTTFYSPLEPGPLNPANMPINWIGLTIQGAGNPTSGNFVFAGATLYAYLDYKPDYQSSAGVPTR